MISWEFLPFNLRWVRQLTWETTLGDCESNPLLFPDEATGIDLIFHISLQEFTKVLSALEKGATLSYPSEDWDVVWFFLRNFECPMSICEQIIACVENDTDVQQAIVNMLAANDSFNQYLQQQTRGINPGPGGITGKIIGGDCDNSVVAGKVKAIVDAMNQSNLDWFEKIEVGTNDEEKFALALEAIPVVGELPFDQVIEFLEDILEDFTENYEAQVDAALLEEWYCGLYCIAIAKDDCSLTYGDIYGFFSERTGSELSPLSAVGDVVNFIRSGDFSGGTRVADGMMMLQSGLMTNGRSFMGSSLPTLGFATRDAPTSTFWEDCAECPESEPWLKIVMGPDDSIELLSDDGDTQTWRLKTYVTGHYLTGGALSNNAGTLYILSVDYNPALTGPDIRFYFESMSGLPENTPCNIGWTRLWIYNSRPDTWVDIVVSKTPCVPGEWDVGPEGGSIISQNATTLYMQAEPATGGGYRVEGGWGGDNYVTGTAFSTSIGVTSIEYSDVDTGLWTEGSPVGKNFDGIRVYGPSSFNFTLNFVSVE